MPLRPEVELLVLCARTRLSEAQAVRAAELAREVRDWEGVASRAEDHGVAPLLVRHLESACPEAASDAALEPLRFYAHGSSLYSRMLARELAAVMRRLRERGIPALPFKGPALAALAHGDVTLRVSGDLDILVRPDRVWSGCDALASLGYRLLPPLTPEQRNAHLHTRYNCKLEREPGPFRIELHWRFAPRQFTFPLGFDALWERRRSLTLEGETIDSPCPEDLLLILCLHGCKHGWKRLGWLADVAELLRAHPDLRWADLGAEARRTGSTRRLALGLRLAQEVLDAPLPEAAAALLARGPGPCRQLDQARAWLLHDVKRKGPPGLELSLFNLRLMDRVAHRVQFCLQPLRHYGYAARRHLLPSWLARRPS